MQTFLVDPSFGETARLLDNRRLGKQRVEAYQIYLALQPNSNSRWKNHPAVKMWKGYEYELLLYCWTMCREWVLARGFKDSIIDKINPIMQKMESMRIYWPETPLRYNLEFQSRHRAALLAKDPAHYGKFGWIETPKIDYLWPISNSEPQHESHKQTLRS